MACLKKHVVSAYGAT